MSARRRIAWFSPLDPEGDSAADYSTRQLLPHLLKKYDIELFTDKPGPGLPEVRADHFLNARHRHERAPFDLCVYNIEDHPRARFVRAHLGILPGIVWLHEAAIADLGAEAFHASPWEHTLDKFLDDSTPFNPRENPVHPLWPLAYRERSLGTLVLASSHAALRRLGELSGRRLEAFPGGHRLRHIPMPVSLGTAIPPVRANATLRIAAACRAGIEGQMHKVFGALAQLGSPWSMRWMIDSTETSAAHALIDEFQVGEMVTVVPGRSPRVWEGILADAALALHLHHSPFYRTSPYLEISMGAGRPAIVTAFPEFRDFPDDAVFRVEPGRFGIAELKGIFTVVRDTPPGALGTRGRALIVEAHAPERVATELSGVFDAHIPAYATILRRWMALERSGTAALLDEVRALAQSQEREDLLSDADFVRKFFDEFGGTTPNR